MFYLTTHSTHFIYGYMASDIWLRTILIVRKETRCRHIGYNYRLTARVLLYAPSHRQDNTYHSLCYTSRGALAGTRNSSMGLPHEGSIRRLNCTMSECSTSELCPAPEGVREEEICEKVLHQSRIKVRQNNELVPTNTLILTFNTPTLPDSVKPGYLCIPVVLYTPNPLPIMVLQMSNVWARTKYMSWKIDMCSMWSI